MSAIRDWGSTEAERRDDYPCDDLVPLADDALYRAIDVAAPPATLYRWLCQLRAAPYSYDWLDNLGRRSPRELTPGLEHLAAGDRFMKIFRLVDFAPDAHVTLVLDDVLAWRLFGELAVTYRVTATASGSRLVAKLLVRRPRGAAKLLAPLLPAGDFVMMRKQLLTLKALAEAHST